MVSFSVRRFLIKIKQPNVKTNVNAFNKTSHNVARTSALMLFKYTRQVYGMSYNYAVSN